MFHTPYLKGKKLIEAARPNGQKLLALGWGLLPVLKPLAKPE